jgi:quercetin dioxygenase-like cupin family protein
MKTAQKLGMAMVVVGVAVVAGLHGGLAQQAPPTENKGITVKTLAAIDLGPQFEAMAGRQLRMRLVTVEPGGVLGIHDHKDRPNTDYIVQGAIVDHRGSEAKEYGPGTSFYEDKNTVHWVENKGTIPAIIIAADIFKP